MDEAMLEKLAKALYEADPEGEFQESDVEWQYNFAHKERYTALATAAASWFLAASAT